MIQYTATDSKSRVDLRRAVEYCYADPTGHLYMPAVIPRLPDAYFNNIQEMNLCEIAYVVISTLTGGDIDPRLVKKVVDRAFNYPMPLVDVASHPPMHVLELFHGPTLSCKDISARFMTAFLSGENGGRLKMLVATTGNTGAALANAIGSRDDIDLMVLYPRGGLSRSRIAQFANGSSHVIPVEVAGTIEACQELVREAAMDRSLEDGGLKILSANTHNILRLLPLTVVYFHAYAQLRRQMGRKADGCTVAVAGGNLSMLTAAVIARRMGLPIGRIVVGRVTGRSAYAPALNIRRPVNEPRIDWLYNNDTERRAADITTVEVTDDDIARAILTTDADGYLPDPHTGAAIAAARIVAPADKQLIVMATAHPAKSLDVMTHITGRSLELPLQLTRFMARPTPSVKIPPTYAALRRLIVS